MFTNANTAKRTRSANELRSAFISNVTYPYLELFDYSYIFPAISSLIIRRSRVDTASLCFK